MKVNRADIIKRRWETLSSKYSYEKNSAVTKSGDLAQGLRHNLPAAKRKRQDPSQSEKQQRNARAAVEDQENAEQE